MQMDDAIPIYAYLSGKVNPARLDNSRFRTNTPVCDAGASDVHHAERNVHGGGDFGDGGNVARAVVKENMRFEHL